MNDKGDNTEREKEDEEEKPEHFSSTTQHGSIKLLRKVDDKQIIIILHFHRYFG